MIETAAPAVELALALLRTPARVSACRQQPLPNDCLLLVRIVAGDRDALRTAEAATGQAAETLREASEFFLQQVLFAPEADSYRVLGADPDWPTDRIKENYRWLVRWLHPDRNPDAWVALFADRVNRAWQDLRVEERRRAYDLARGPSGEVPAARGGEAPIARAWRQSGEMPAVAAPRLSARTVRRLPMIVLGGLAGAAAIVLGVAYYAQTHAPGDAGEEDVVALPAPPTPSLAPTVAPAPVPPTAIPAAIPPARRSVPAPAALATLAPRPPVPKPGPVSAPARRAQPPASAAVPRNPAPVLAAAPAARAAPPAPSAPEAVAAAPASDALAATVPPPPAAAAPDAVPATSLPLAPDDWLRRFSGAYASGDLARFQALLSDGGADAPYRRELLREYSRVFRDTASRRIEISGPSWINYGQRGVLMARYDAWLMPAGESRVRHLTGAIRFDLVAQAGEWRISQLRQDGQRHD